MTAEQLTGAVSPDGSKYSCPTDGNGTILTFTTSSSGHAKQLNGLFAPDNSMYITLTDGNGNLT